MEAAPRIEIESTLEILKTAHAQSPILSSLLIWFFTLDRTFTFTDTLQFGRYRQDFLFVNTKLCFLRPIEKPTLKTLTDQKIIHILPFILL